MSRIRQVTELSPITRKTGLSSGQVGSSGSSSSIVSCSTPSEDMGYYSCP